MRPDLSLRTLIALSAAAAIFIASRPAAAQTTIRVGTDPVDIAIDTTRNKVYVANESSDNVTVIALEWETPDSFESTRGISTDSISDGVFASTIQAGVLDTLVDDLDDAAIERSIAEINEAIRRSAARKT